MTEINLLDSPEIKYIHFIGIGGISMSGLAEILLNLGYRISGSDMKASNITQRLEEKGIKFSPFHSEENISNPDLVVYTAAVKDDNPELMKARNMNIPAVERAVMLGQIMKRYPFSIAVSGTHGKTTTTSMVTMIMLEAGMDPTVHIGGELTAIGGNTKIGGNRYFITEACEYVESFLKFHPYLAIILNIEADHLDYFKDLEHIKSSFGKFAALVPGEGYIVANADDPDVLSVIDGVNCKKTTYGLKAKDSNWSAEDVKFDESGHASYSLLFNNEKLTEIKLSVPGIHNVSNSLAAIAACYTLGCDIEAIKQALLKFTGTHRRFELKGIVNGITVIDDYAHHPSEVKATLKAAKNGSYSKIWCVFQPHTYTRTKALLDEFAVAFEDTDSVIVADIYAAREKDSGEIHASKLAEKVTAAGKTAVYISGFDSIVEYLNKSVLPGDLVITMGAGDIYKAGEMFLKK